MSYEKRLLSPFVWCSNCGARRALLGGEVCRICIARVGRLPDHANRPRARTRYRASGRCSKCGAPRDRPDRTACARCRRRLADATARYRAGHPPDLPRLYADMRERRRRRSAAGLCSECGAARDRADRLMCERCRARAAVKTARYRCRKAAA